MAEQRSFKPKVAGSSPAAPIHSRGPLGLTFVFVAWCNGNITVLGTVAVGSTPTVLIFLVSFF